MNNSTNTVATLVGTVIGLVISVGVEYCFTKKACKDAIVEHEAEKAAEIVKAHIRDAE